MARKAVAKAATETPRRRAFGRLRELPSGRWQVSYLHNGAVHKAPATFPGVRPGVAPESAIAWLDNEQADIELDRKRPGAWTPPAERAAAARAAVVKLTFADYSKRWLARRKDDLAPHTFRSYETDLRVHLVPVLGEIPLRDLTSEQVRDWYAAMGKDKPKRRARAYGTLTAILNTAVTDDLIPRSPANVKGGTAVKSTAHKPVLLTPAELDALAAKLPESLALTVVLAGWLGLRRGELFALTRADIADDGSVVEINKSMTAYGRAVHVGPTKTVESERRVTVPPHIRPAVVEHLKAHVGPAKAALLFTDSATGSYITEGRYRPHFFAAREAIDQPDLHFHDLRHFGGTMAAYTGATLREIQARLGHTTVSAAMRYQAVAKAREDEMADRLSALAAVNHNA